jgi:Domain of unknown function (DUF5916)
MQKTLYIILLFFFSSNLLLAQAPTRPIIAAKKVAKAIKIDGKLDEAAWKEAALANNFIEFRPTPLKPEANLSRTESFLMYNDEGIYFGGKCYEQTMDSISRELVGRDGFGNNDFIGISFDTYKDNQNGFEYFITPLGEQFDAKISVGNNGEDFSWNAVWEGKSIIEKDGWSFEMFIPFSAIRFGKSKMQNWGINILRNRVKTGQLLTWASLNPQINGALTQEGFWNGLSDIKPPLRLQFSPYLSYYTTVFTKTDPGEKKAVQQVNGGMDVKYGINQAFTLDMALIPDFGQVQTDNRVLNIGPFEQQYQENRPFFTEGVELFSKGDLFYARRIGKNPVQVNYDYYNNLNANEKIIKDPQETKILNATKVSGRMQNGLAIGVLNAVTGVQRATVQNTITNAERKVNSYPLTNYNVLVVDKTLKNNSSISFVNSNVTRNGSDYDANVSMFLADFYDKKNTWNIGGNVAISNLIGAGNNGETITGYAQNIYMGKNSGRLTFNINSNLVTDKFDKNDLGYQSNNNTFDNRYYVGYRWTKPKGFYNNMGMNFNGSVSRLFKPLDPLKQKGHMFQEYFTAINFFGQTKKLWNFYSNINNRIQANDYYEARTEGRVFKRGGRSSLFLNINSNEAKKYSFGFGLGLRKGRQFKSTYGTTLETNHKIRFNPKVSLDLGISIETVHDQGGFGKKISNNEIIFTKRDNRTIENGLGLKWSFTNKMGLTLGVRHYWSSLIPKELYLLNIDGSLSPYSTTAFTPQDLSFNTNFFTVNMVYTWQIVNGSFLTIAYQDDASDFVRGVSEKNYFKNIDKTFSVNHANTISVKMVYFIDYLSLKKKGK